MPSAAFTTLGCKVNQYETQKILESFEDAGFSIVPFESAADVYVINTCSVTSIAESKSHYAIRRATRHNPDAKVVVTGCAAQMSLNKGESVASADVLVPNPEKLESLKYFLDAFPDFMARLAAEPRSEIAKPPGRTRATMKIQDGCNFFCSYCSIPYTRPGMVSRPYAEVLDEAKKLAGMGYQEIILTGVLIGAYGPETGSGGPVFEDLVDGLAEDSGIPRIRISSIEMRQVTPRLVGQIQAGKVVPHLHIPLQSGDDHVMRDMNRGYTQADYIACCKMLQREVPDISISTDIMVGFPTETDERFLSSAHVCETVGFIKAHVFSFSPRFGTPADQWGDPVSPAEKSRRREVLTAIANRTAAAHYQKFLGRRMRVVVEGKIGRDGLLEGLTDNYLTVKLAGSPTLARTAVWVDLCEYRDGVIYGELANGPASSLPQYPFGVRSAMTAFPSESNRANL